MEIATMVREKNILSTNMVLHSNHGTLCNFINYSARSVWQPIFVQNICARGSGASCLEICNQVPFSLRARIMNGRLCTPWLAAYIILHVQNGWLCVCKRSGRTFSPDKIANFAIFCFVFLFNDAAHLDFSHPKFSLSFTEACDWFRLASHRKLHRWLILDLWIIRLNIIHAPKACAPFANQPKIF